MDLTDQQWTIVEPLFEEKRRPDGRGRPWRDARAVLNGVLWVLRTGAPWHDLPDRYPPYQTCHRRFQQWRKNGVFRDLLTCLAEDLPTGLTTAKESKHWPSRFRPMVPVTGCGSLDVGRSDGQLPGAGG